jgi:hypothetical protein
MGPSVVRVHAALGCAGLTVVRGVVQEAAGESSQNDE